MDEAPKNAEVSLERAVLARSVHCVQCGYDMRGLRMSGQCPECGLDVWQTVQHVVDPASRLLPRVRNPRKVGNALVLLILCLLVASVLLFARPVAMTIDSIRASGAARLAVWTPPTAFVLGGVVILLGVAPVVQLTPPAKAEDGGARGDLLMLALGMVLLGVSVLAATIAAETLADGGNALAVMQAVLWSLMIVGAVVLLVYLRRMLRLVGERSRSFRTSRMGRQRVREMIVAVAGVGVGGLLRDLGGIVPRGSWPLPQIEPATLGAIGTVLLLICGIMVVIGFAYLLVNAWWIRASLLAPPPTLRGLIRET